MHRKPPVLPQPFALADLERQFDGPIPEHLRQAALFGSPEVVRLTRLEARAAFYRSQAVRQYWHVLGPRRRDGTACADMRSDLLLYIREARAAERKADDLRARLLGPAAESGDSLWLQAAE